MDNKKLWYSFFMLMGIISFGTLGYYLLEDMTLFESFYMTIITISTVGFSEIKPLTPASRVITIFIIFLGIGVGHVIGEAVRKV